MIPLYKEQLEIIMKNKENIQQMASSLYTMGSALGNLVMPLLGGFLYDTLGGNINAQVYKIEEREVYLFLAIKYIRLLGNLS